MYATQVKTNKKLRAENKELKARIVELETENKELRDRVEKLELIVEELHAMIFKKTKK
jgi:cell division protein FtsB